MVWQIFPVFHPLLNVCCLDAGPENIHYGSSNETKCFTTLSKVNTFGGELSIDMGNLLDHCKR